MNRKLGTAIAAAACIAIGYFLEQTGEIVGWSARPPEATRGNAAPAGAPGSSSGAGYADAPADTGTAAPVEVAPAVARGIRERVRGSGLLEPDREVTIVARVEGEVEEILVEEGERIEAGAALCAIDEEPLRIASDVARIARDQAVRTHERLVELVASRSATSQESDDARFARDRAEAQYEKATIDLAHARPLAPFAGTVIAREIEIGQMVRPGEVLFRIADFEPLRLRMHLPESEVVAVVVGQVAELRAERDGVLVTRGSVERISPVVDRESLTVEVVVRFEFASGQVRPGSFGHADIITRTEADAVLIPRRAVLRADGESYLFRVYDGRAHRTQVRTGYEDEMVVQIHEGIAPGDLVVTEGTRELRDGQVVEIYRETPVPLDPMAVEHGGAGQG